MDRRLILMRHAKSAWHTDAVSDHDRPLNDRGRRDAPKIAQRLSDLDWLPDSVLSSDSKRTRQTWEQMAGVLTDPPEPLFTAELYHGGLNALWNEAHSLDAELETLLFLGHNPGCEEILYRLAGISERMTTANAALLEGTGDDWPSAIEGTWRLVELLRPKGI